VTEGPDPGGAYVISPGESRTVGRTDKAQIVIEKDTFLSSVHFEIANRNGTAWVVDHQSKNKTRVNKEIVQEREVAPGDSIRAGNTTFTVAWEGVSQPVHPIEGIVEHTIVDEVIPDSIVTDSATSAIREPTPKVGDREKISSPIESADPNFFDAWHSQVQNADKPNPPIVSDLRESAPIPDAVDTPDSNLLFSESGEEPVEDSRNVSDPWGNIEKEHTVCDEPILADAVVTNRPAKPEEVSTPSINSSEARQSIKRSDFHRMVQVLEHGSQEFARIVADLAKKIDFYAIAHFKKLGVETPLEVPASGLLPAVDGSRGYFPVAIHASDWIANCHRDWCVPLVENDGFMLVLCEDRAKAFGDMTALASKPVIGYSRANGFVPWFWPSNLELLTDSMSDRTIEQWIGEGLGGFVFPAWRGGKAVGLVRGDFYDALLQAGFE
jgi:pSer/pThr/pTyr-binding forkhead associated (FHA) protein